MEAIMSLAHERERERKEKIEESKKRWVNWPLVSLWKDVSGCCYSRLRRVGSCVHSKIKRQSFWRVYTFLLMKLRIEKCEVNSLRKRRSGEKSYFGHRRMNHRYKGKIQPCDLRCSCSRVRWVDFVRESTLKMLLRRKRVRLRLFLSPLSSVCKLKQRKEGRSGKWKSE